LQPGRTGANCGFADIGTGSSPINDNVLTDLPKRVDDGFFIGFSFRFMSPGESFFTKNIVTEPEDSGSK
jgi:hypothetical protein